MKKINLFFPIILFIVIIIFLWRGLELNPGEIPSPLIGKSAPSFSAHALFHSKKIVTEKIFLGHVTVFNVFATWCVSCGEEHPQLMALHKKDPKVQMIGVAFKDERKAVMEYLIRSGDPFNTVIDDEAGDVAIDFGVYGTPETFVIDQKGIVRNKIIGPISPEMLKDELLPLLKKLQR